MERVFALDIGTRKIFGVVVEKDPEEEKYRIVASKMIPHTTRAMMDGQIHDVPAVAKTITKVKQFLERELGEPLTSAAVAAAGRALETRIGKAQEDWSMVREITAEDVGALELTAVQSAQTALQLDAADNHYLCVGYSVVRYCVEDQEIGSLIGQLGSQVSVEVIATFLPRVVVDSLFSALKKADLELRSMTLEPIAALTIGIPANMRLLNLALIDIGAGTSDIALVKEGGIFAYAMVPQGGDEITEALSQTFLLDFNTAENLKCEMSEAESAVYSDILGNEGLLTREDFLHTIQPVCVRMIQEIAENILKRNGKAPDAVILIGGGSLTPGLTEMLAESMEMSKNRVGIKNQISESFIECPADYFFGPQGITPLGIAYESFLKNGLPLLKVMVNHQEVSLWNTDEADVARALINSGIQLNQIHGRPGLGKTIEWNGEIQVFPGTMGSAPSIRINQAAANLSTPIREGDEIEFTPGQNGEDGVIVLPDIGEFAPATVIINGKPVSFPVSLWVNDVPYVKDQEIPDRAKVEVRATCLIKELLKTSGLEETYLQEQFLQYYVDEAMQKTTWIPLAVMLNDEPAQLNQEASQGDIITYKKLNLTPTFKDIFTEVEFFSEIKILVNQTPVILPVTGAQLWKNGQPVKPDDPIKRNDFITVQAITESAILSDVFNHYEMGSEPGKRLVIMVNDEEAGFVTPLKNGDRVTLSWL